MSLCCDSCMGEIVDQTRPEAFVPLANGGGVDLCQACKEHLKRYFPEPERASIPDEYPNERVES